MKKIIGIAFIAFLGLGFSSFINNESKPTEESSGLEWYTNLDEVHKLSKETGKPIFGFFTGSDWCGWCHKLQRDVFAKQAFIDWAKEEVILLELDFPRKKQLEPALQKQNQDLQQAFRVTGYPTIWIFNTEKDEETNKYNISALGKLGYPSGAVPGKEEDLFLKNANDILATNK